MTPARLEEVARGFAERLRALCLDNYKGGYGGAEYEAFKAGMDTACNCIAAGDEAGRNSLASLLARVASEEREREKERCIDAVEDEYGMGCDGVIETIAAAIRGGA